jgi:RNA polymerase sigma factor (sigma-70 family)
VANLVGHDVFDESGHQCVGKRQLRCTRIERARLAYDGLQPYRPYLTRIAKNLLIDEGRRLGREPVWEDVSAQELAQALPSDPGAEDELEWRPLREAARAYCAALEPRLRRLIQLRFEEERSQNEVAEALGLSRRNVRTLEAKAREGLRAYLRERSLL